MAEQDEEKDYPFDISSLPEGEPIVDVEAALRIETTLYYTWAAERLLKRVDSERRIYGNYAATKEYACESVVVRYLNFGQIIKVINVGYCQHFQSNILRFLIRG